MTEHDSRVINIYIPCSKRRAVSPFLRWADTAAGAVS